MSESVYIPLSKDVLEEIANDGRAYTNEAKVMALEILDRRAKDQAPPAPNFDWAAFLP